MSAPSAREGEVGVAGAAAMLRIAPGTLRRAHIYERVLQPRIERLPAGALRRWYSIDAIKRYACSLDVHLIETTTIALDLAAEQVENEPDGPCPSLTWTLRGLRARSIYEREGNTDRLAELDRALDLARATGRVPASIACWIGEPVAPRPRRTRCA